MKKIITPLLLLAILFVGSCKKNTDDNDDNNLPYGFGWEGQDDDPTTVPQAVNPTTFAAQTLPASVDLLPKFPPIGDQGQYGTCVAWAAGYNIKTVIDGLDRGLTTTQLTATNNQFSPKDLFTALDDNLKGPDCGGTEFTDALEVILNRGIATYQTVPYTNLGNCAKSTLQASWTSEAAGHKIKNYRRIALDKNEIKTYLSNNVPVLFGAKLGDNFMQWNSDDVISSNTSFDQVGQHAYHAMTLSGYDDSKGPNGAFQVSNSWGTNWGNSGKIWIDYNFFLNTHCYNNNVFIATNSEGSPTPPAPDPVQTGNVDLAAWAFNDYSTSGTQRYIEFNVYNIGDQTAQASTGWALYYLYYNAYDADDYGFLIVDIADNSLAPLTTWEDVNTGYVYFNSPIYGGSNLANDLFSPSTYIYQYYNVPNITGYYYLCLYADPMDVIPETDETNNYFYTTGQDAITFVNGVGKRDIPAKPIAEYRLNNKLEANITNLKSKQFRTAVNSTNPNAYSPEEIKLMIKKEKQSGRWQAKLSSFLADHPTYNLSGMKMMPGNTSHK